MASRLRGGEAGLISEGVVTPSNARLVTFAVHEYTDCTQVSGPLMPRYQTPRSGEPTFPCNAKDLRCRVVPALQNDWRQAPHARSTTRRIMNSVLGSRRSLAPLRCEAHRVMLSIRRTHLTRRSASFTVRCTCGAANGSSASCWIAVMIVLCTWRERNAFKASSWKSCGTHPMCGRPWHSAS